ncbi:MAG: hypothetical protein LBC43_02380, partial [Bifidobacteriaceae bacterium]|nr:hypothetical protein [Bifidobacteriaceae bacterium]
MIKVSPSLMCAKFTQLEEYIQLLDQAEVDFFHIDVMDGTFAPNFVFGTDDIRTIRELTNRPLDFHLMVDDPAYKLDWFEIRKGDRVAVHLEAQENTQLSLNKLREFEAEVFLAIEVDTQINKLEPY